MKCPKCEKKMEEGLVSLLTSENASVCWSKEEPPGIWQEMLSDFKLRDKWKREILMRNGVIPVEKGQRIRKGFRCSNCRIVFLEY